MSAYVMPHEISQPLRDPFPSQIRVRLWQWHWHRISEYYRCYNGSGGGEALPGPYSVAKVQCGHVTERMFLWSLYQSCQQPQCEPFDG